MNGNCTLRQWRLEDAKPLAELLNNKMIQDMLRDGLPYPYTEKDAVEYITRMAALDKSMEFPFAVVADGRVVGSIHASRGENIHFRTAEIGYYISQSHWGNGIGTGAVTQLCAFIFQHTNILRIFAQPFSENLASCRVLEKSGFQLEGVLHKNAYKNGKSKDMKMYALLKETSCKTHSKKD